MIPGLGSIIDRVTGLFGKTYFLAGFLPVLFLAAVSLLAGYDVSPWMFRQVNAFRGLDAARQALASGVLLVAIAMLGFVFWSANPWLRALLEGAPLAGRLHGWLVRDQQERLAALETGVRACEERMFGFRIRQPDPELPEPEPIATPAVPSAAPEPAGLIQRLAALFRNPAPVGEPVSAIAPRIDGGAEPMAAADDAAPFEDDAPVPWMQRLLAARLRGAALSGVPARSSPSAALSGAYQALREQIGGLEPVDASALDGVCALLERELAAGPVVASSALDRMHVGFEDLAVLARARAENAWSRALTARRMRFPVNLSAVGPTRMANVSELYRDYALTRYGLDPEVFWLHLQHAAAANDRFRPILEEARLKLDVSVAMAAACGLSSIWAVVLGLWGHSVPLLLLTGVGMPIAALMFYRATVTNLRVYGDAVRATVDLFRFDVLKALHLPIPADARGERRTWESLTQANQLLGEGEMAYDHP